MVCIDLLKNYIIVYNDGGGVWKGPKKDYVICEQPPYFNGD